MSAEPFLPFVVAVGGGKGGVGKSTTAVNLARALISMGVPPGVGLIDLDLSCPNAPQVLAVEPLSPQQFRTDGIVPAVYPGPLQVATVGLQIPPGLANLRDDNWRTALVRTYATQMDWVYPVRFIVLDLPPGTGAETQEALLAFPNLLGAVVVCTGREESLVDAERFVAMVLELKKPVLGFVQNMVAAECPFCHGMFGLFGGEVSEARLGVPALARVPYVSRPEFNTEIHLRGLARRLAGMTGGGE